MSRAELLARAHADWPGIKVDDEDFLRHVAGRLPEGGAPEDLVVSDLYLAFAAARADPAAVRAFERDLIPAAEPALARFRGDAAFVADALQELRLRLLVGPPPRILEYAGRGPLVAWVKVVAARVALNLRRDNARHAPAAFEVDHDSPDLAGELRDPELKILQQRYRDSVQQAIRHAFGTLERRERTLLRLYVVDQLNIGEIGAIVGKSRATVGRAIVDLRARLLDATRERLAVILGARAGELDSVFRLVQSQLDVTLSGLLASGVASAER